MHSSLLPERPLLISPTLASTIGLEEAVMLHVLAELLTLRSTRIKDKLKWIELTDPFLCTAFPYWLLIDIKRILNSLQNLGLVVIDPVANNPDGYYLAINQQAESEHTTRNKSRQSTHGTHFSQGTHQGFSVWQSRRGVKAPIDTAPHRPRCVV